MQIVYVISNNNHYINVYQYQLLNAFPSLITKKYKVKRTNGLTIRILG